MTYRRDLANCQGTAIMVGTFKVQSSKFGGGGRGGGDEMMCCVALCYTGGGGGGGGGGLGCVHCVFTINSTWPHHFNFLFASNSLVTL